MVTVSSLLYVKRPVVPPAARPGLGLVGVAGEDHRSHPPTHRLSFYTDL